MPSPATKSSTKGLLNTSHVSPRFGSTKLASAIVRAALALAVLAALLLIAALPAQAQTEAVLYNFTGGSDGANPLVGLTSDGAGNFYGTTYYGGLGNGTVFEVSPNGNGGWNETVLYSFTGAADGRGPSYSRLIFDSVGNLYGTTEGGGANYSGVVFKLSPVGTSWTETVLYNFCSQGGYDCTPCVTDLPHSMHDNGDLIGAARSVSVFPDGPRSCPKPIFSAI